MFKLMGVTNVLLKPVNNLPEFDVSSFPTSPATPAKIWAGAQELLRTILTPDIFNLWFAQLKAVACDSESITLEVANDFCELWLKDNYLGLIQDALAHASGKQLKVNFKVASHTLAAKNSKVSVANVEANGEGALEEIGEETPRSSARGVREIKETREVRELPQSKDTHGFRFIPPDRLQPPTIYPGTPEPTAFDEKAAGCVAVTFISRQRRATVRPERVAHWTWEEAHLTTIAELRHLNIAKNTIWYWTGLYWVSGCVLLWFAARRA